MNKIEEAKTKENRAIFVDEILLFCTINDFINKDSITHVIKEYKKFVCSDKVKTVIIASVAGEKRIYFTDVKIIELRKLIEKDNFIIV